MKMRRLQCIKNYTNKLTFVFEKISTRFQNILYKIVKKISKVFCRFLKS